VKKEKNMELDRRKSTRVDIPVVLRFKSEKQSADYSWGLTRNISTEGFSFESINFKHKPHEILEFNLQFPERSKTISLTGDVVWKKEIHDANVTGVRLKEINKEKRREFLEELSSHGNVPLNSFFGPEASKSITKMIYEEKLKTDSTAMQKNIQLTLDKTKTAGIKKRYLGLGASCKVTFVLPKEAALDAETVTIVGDFNDWNRENIVMKRLKNGDFAVTLQLKAGKEYKYRYFIDGHRWENDWNADRYDPNPFGWHDSVVIV
jgi:hypothetical protein